MERKPYGSLANTQALADYVLLQQLAKGPSNLTIRRGEIRKFPLFPQPCFLIFLSRIPMRLLPQAKHRESQAHFSKPCYVKWGLFSETKTHCFISYPIAFNRCNLTPAHLLVTSLSVIFILGNGFNCRTHYYSIQSNFQSPLFNSP